MTIDGKLFSGVSVLFAVVEAGTIARAAEALGLSPSGVSRALARLEQRVGARLLARTTRTLSLTDEGRRFYEQVGPHLDAIEEAAIEAAGSADRVRGRLRVNIDPYFSRVVLSKHMAKFLARYPELFVELIMRDSVGDLVADGFDLALRFGEPPTGSFVARKLAQTRVVTVASPGYLKAHGKPAHPRDIETRDCIDFYDATNGRPYPWELHRKGEVLSLRVKGRLLTSDSGTLLGACEAGFGIAQIIEIGCEALLRSGRLVELFPGWSDERFPLYAIFPSRLHRAAKVRAFVDFVSEILKANAA
ncbi:LysR family transcriptional regulator [Paraburkholderia caballeronis]|uniref:DNA-binding transcriptional regulator, LysR family n=1 Tax=Paraburkholderia caballeronis TaxID=416943 RepID=A0A1H7T0Q0_9BURK|nr:LysR family transcriptional regulator [Paraburkholderia caballeronis]PXW25728.1 DNA-binding transcriptional LysR family regulator [Paraburkholderia caballeronis]PXX01335.1 DNA-binding transcriptional LysR family regulator [Paraburkholderia caballeronis]RAJ99311.1 DNA-binding transcriptional LysR family regulator [Paraburkholderia caballeronis]TDV05479.1 DNA-binding transcriptional LysR family regulator [Paraburkholderia caballeronis]TDV09106.1 DNA-binding transcriptional LysR family regulat